MLLLLGSIWVIGVVVAATRTLAQAVTMTVMMTGNAAIVIRTGVVMIATNETATITAGTTGTGATAGVLRLGLATPRITEGGGATLGALRGVAVQSVVGITMLPPALCPLTATVNLAGEATVR